MLNEYLVMMIIKSLITGSSLKAVIGLQVNIFVFSLQHSFVCVHLGVERLQTAFISRNKQNVPFRSR